MNADRNLADQPRDWDILDVSCAHIWYGSQCCCSYFVFLKLWPISTSGHQKGKEHYWCCILRICESRRFCWQAVLEEESWREWIWWLSRWRWNLDRAFRSLADKHLVQPGGKGNLSSQAAAAAKWSRQPAKHHNMKGGGKLIDFQLIRPWTCTLFSQYQPVGFLRQLE